MAACLTRLNDFVLSPTAESGWLLVEEGVDPAREREIEWLFAVGNGYLGMRASVGEGTRFSHPSIFVAGIWTADGGSGPRLAVLPDWLHVEVTVEDERLSLETGHSVAHRRRLDLRQGLLWREWRQQDPSGRITRLTYIQLASLADRHVIFQSVAATAENYAGRISLTARLCSADATRTDIQQVVAESGALRMRVSDKDIGIATASEVQGLAALQARDRVGTDGREERWSWQATLGETVRLDRIFTIFTSRDVANVAKAARDHLTSICAGGFRRVAAVHIDAWQRRRNAP